MFFEANHRGPAYQTGLALRFQKLPVDLKFHEVILRRRFGIMIKVSQLSLCAVTRRPRCFMPHSQGITYQLPTKLNTTFHRFHPTNSHLHQQDRYTYQTSGLGPSHCSHVIRTRAPNKPHSARIRSPQHKSTFPQSQPSLTPITNFHSHSPKKKRNLSELPGFCSSQ